MTKELIANVEPYETRVAVLDEGALINLFIERGDPLAGNIYKGRVSNVLPGMEAAFVDIGLERNAFLHVGDIRSQRLAGEEIEESFGKGAIAERLRVGQEILVQVTKEPMGSKGARVTTYVALPAYYLVLMPTVNYVGVSRRIERDQERKRLRQLAEKLRPKGMGIIVRTAAEGASEKDLADDVEFLLQMWNRVEERSRASRAPALVYQDLRLIRRVVRDQFTEEVSRFLIDSPEEHHRVGDLLNSFAPKLKSRLQLYQGPEPIFEHTGVYQDLEEVLRMPCPYCEGRGRVFSPETMGMKVRRELRKVMTTTRAAAILADVNPDVHGFLFREGEGWVRHIEQQTGRRLRVRAREGMHLERLRVAEGPSLEELERAPIRQEREQVGWLDYGPAEAIGVGEGEEEHDLALTQSGRSDGLAARLRRLLRRP